MRVALLHRLATMRNGGGSVPLLMHESRRLIDSTAVVKHADSTRGGGMLYPREAGLRLEVEAITRRFETGLGVHAHRWAYAHLLTETSLLRQCGRATFRGLRLDWFR